MNNQMWAGGSPNFNESTGQYWGNQPQITQDWQFGGGAKYRPGMDPMRDQRMWAGAQHGFNSFLKNLPTMQQRRGMKYNGRGMAWNQNMPPISNFSQFINQGRQNVGSGFGQY